MVGQLVGLWEHVNMWRPSAKEERVIGHCVWACLRAQPQHLGDQAAHLCGFSGVSSVLSIAVSYHVDKHNLFDMLSMPGVVEHGMLPLAGPVVVVLADASAALCARGAPRCSTRWLSKCVTVWWALQYCSL